MTLIRYELKKISAKITIAILMDGNVDAKQNMEK